MMFSRKEGKLSGLTVAEYSELRSRGGCTKSIPKGG